ncbi:cytochrome c family protein [Anaeromyxobacter oryzae]|uniref:cytochrome c family protein n=1 Tax=Anaeromyxobacter oryzae TaxID=2918170 RepID=UPI0020BECB7B|nr:cytochrome c family protein [Anaeromyxobacter oryzae]
MSRSLVRALAVAAVLASAAARAAGDKVGPETCRACHPSAFDAWHASPHARALESLPERSRKDPRCLSCHAPDLDDGLSGVSCESCHGPGRMYAARYVMRDPELSRAVGLADPGEKRCLACHTDSTPSLEKFDYARKLPLIAHGREPAAEPPRPAHRQGEAKPPPVPARPAHPAGR